MHLRIGKKTTILCKMRNKTHNLCKIKTPPFLANVPSFLSFYFSFLFSFSFAFFLFFFLFLFPFLLVNKLSYIICPSCFKAFKKKNRKQDNNIMVAKFELCIPFLIMNLAPKYLLTVLFCMSQSFSGLEYGTEKIIHCDDG